MEIVFDLEAGGLDFDSPFYVLYGEGGREHICWTRSEARLLVGTWLGDERCVLIGHNIITYDLPLLFYGVKMPEVKAMIMDTRLLSQIRCPFRLHHSLESYGEQFGVPKVEVTEEQWREGDRELMLKRCVRDVKINTMVYRYLLEKGGPLKEWYPRIEGAWAPYMVESISRGIPFRCSMTTKTLKGLQERRREIRESVEVKNPGSVKQWGEHLYPREMEMLAAKKKHINENPWENVHKVEVERLKGEGVPLTDKGNFSLSKDNRVEVTSRHPDLALHYEYKELGVLERYFDPLNDKKSGLWRSLKCPFRQTHIFPHVSYYGTRTGRTIYSEPCINQIPKGVVREAIGPNDVVSGWMVGADAKALELALLAYELKTKLGSTQLWDEVQRGDSPKKLTRTAFTEECFVNIEEGRRDGVAKTINYAILYGQTTPGTRKVLQLPPTMDSKIEAGKKRRFPGLEAFIQYLKSRTVRGKLLNAYGVPVRTLKGDGVTETELNTYMQSTGAFYCRLLFAHFMEEMKRRMNCYVVLLNCDEVQVMVEEDITKEECERLACEAARAAEERFEREKFMGIPLVSALDVMVGRNWNECH